MSDKTFYIAQINSPQLGIDWFNAPARHYIQAEDLGQKFQAAGLDRLKYLVQVASDNSAYGYRIINQSSEVIFTALKETQLQF